MKKTKGEVMGKTDKNYYSLYRNKKEGKLRIVKMGTSHVLIRPAISECKDPNKVYKYNLYYMFSMSRKALKERALDIKDSWVVDAQLELDRLEGVEIK